MKYYDETGNILKSPDLEHGYVTEEKIKIGTERVLMEGTEGMGINGLYRIVPVYETRAIYHENVEEQVEEQTVSIEDRLSAIEDTLDMLLLSELEGE